MTGGFPANGEADDDRCFKQVAAQRQEVVDELAPAMDVCIGQEESHVLVATRRILWRYIGHCG